MEEKDWVEEEKLERLAEGKMMKRVAHAITARLEKDGHPLTETISSGDHSFQINWDEVILVSADGREKLVVRREKKDEGDSTLFIDSILRLDSLGGEEFICFRVYLDEDVLEKDDVEAGKRGLQPEWYFSGEPWDKYNERLIDSLNSWSVESK